MAKNKKSDDMEMVATEEAAPLEAPEPIFEPAAPIAPLAVFTYSDVRHPVRQGNGILCEVKFDANDDHWSFLATPDDVEEHGREIYARCDAGEFGHVPDYFPTDTELSDAAQERIVRELRLANSAVTRYQDRVDVDDATEADIVLLRAWKKYRVDLNRIVEQAGFPYSISWPVAPEAMAV